MVQDAGCRVQGGCRAPCDPAATESSNYSQVGRLVSGTNSSTLEPKRAWAHHIAATESAFESLGGLNGTVRSRCSGELHPMRNIAPLGPYSRTMPRALWKP